MQLSFLIGFVASISLLNFFDIAYSRTRKKPRPKNKNCSNLGEIFVQKNFDGTNCPMETWMEAFRMVDPSPAKNIINIGFNKGYNFALWASLWVPSANVNVQTWFTALKELGVDDCGICNDCKFRIEDTQKYRNGSSKYIESIPRTLVMVGVELNKKNLILINQVSNKFQMLPPIKRNVHIHMVLAAAANTNGKIWIHRCESGSEVCAIASQKETAGKTAIELRREFNFIPVVTVDQLVNDLITQDVLIPYRITKFKSKKNIRIDILFVDTEGYDFSVIAGASESLHQGLIRMLVFEYHRVGQWNSTSLHNVVHDLANMNYDCYFEGQGRLWKLTGCWSSAYEIRKWSNVMCLRRGNIWHRVAERKFRVYIG
eukprot:gene5844-11804_t